MEPLRRRMMRIALKSFDLATMVCGFILAAAGVSYKIQTVSFSEFMQMRVKLENFLLFVFILALWYVFLRAFGFYQRRRLVTIFTELADVFKASGLFALALFIMARLFDLALVTPLFLAILWSATCGAMMISRLVLRLLLRQVRIRGRNLRHLMIVGTNIRSVHFARKIQQMPELGYRLIGFADDKWAAPRKFKRPEWHLVTDLKNFPRFIRENVVDEVVISLPVQSFYRRIQEIVGICEEQGVIVRSIPQLFSCRHAVVETEYVDDITLITCYHGALRGSMILIKRAFDLVLALAGLIVCAPLLLAAAMAVKLDTPGPVFFTQERIGLNKRSFRLIKFRTMVPDAEQRQADLDALNEMDGPVFKVTHDPRITRVGRWLRKTSLDELPQLFNVICGDMSLVGPRPLPRRDFKRFRQDWHRRRFSVRPGITCLWQVQGRNAISFEEWMKLDMLYIDQWSLGLDLIILMKTIPAVLTQKGAY